MRQKTSRLTFPERTAIYDCLKDKVKLLPDNPGYAEYIKPWTSELIVEEIKPTIPNATRYNVDTIFHQMFGKNAYTLNRKTNNEALELLRGLQTCIADLQRRIGRLEKELGVQPADLLSSTHLNSKVAVPDLAIHGPKANGV